jgi:DNA-binding NarL/FixJ family response regulator
MAIRPTALSGPAWSAASPARGAEPVIRVVLADDQRLVRAGFRSLLELEEGFEVCGEAADGLAAVEITRSARPDVVVMDIRMPGADGLAAPRLIAADSELAATRVLILMTFDLDEYVFETLRAGASGFLLKDTDPAELVRGIRLVAAGEALLAPSVTRRLVAAFARGAGEHPVDEAGLVELTRPGAGGARAGGPRAHQ